jgi:hypothetical protein
VSIGPVGLIMLGVWVFALAAGSLFVAVNVPDNRQYIAVKQLKRNHRLVEGDVAEAGLYHRFLIPDVSTRADFHGRYVSHTVQPFETLRLATTSSGPQLTPWRPGHSIVWLSLRDLPVSEAATLDVGDVLHACILNGKSACGAVTVLAVACNGADTSTCNAAVDLTPAQRRHYLDALMKLGKNAPSGGPIGVVTERFGGLR